MNSVLDNLYLRRPKIRYACPPICDAIFSSSSFPIIVLPTIQKPQTPTGLVFDANNSVNLLSWSVVPGAICYSVYLNIDPSNPASPYNLISECTPAGSIAVCSAGWFSITTVNRHGVESAPTTPVFNDGTGYKIIALPRGPGIVCYNLYKNPTITNPIGIGFRYWNCFQDASIEICATGCYRVSAITPQGETDLSPAICTPANCSGTMPCPVCQHWDATECECLSDGSQNCPPSYFFDTTQCTCIPSGGSPQVIILHACLNQMFGNTTMAPPGFNPPCSFNLESGSLPPGMSFVQDSPLTATVSGTPTAEGTFSYSILCVSGQLQALFEYEIHVLGVQPTDAGSYAIGQSVSFQFVGGGGDGGPYTFQEFTPAPPAGLSISQSGLLSGTPQGPPGTYMFGVGITDKNGNTCGIQATVHIFQFGNAAMHGFAACPSNPGLGSDVDIPADTYFSNKSQAAADALANHAMLNQLHADQVALGCPCPPPTVAEGPNGGIVSTYCCQQFINSLNSPLNVNICPGSPYDQILSYWIFNGINPPRPAVTGTLTPTGAVFPSITNHYDP